MTPAQYREMCKDLDTCSLWRSLVLIRKYLHISVSKQKQAEMDGNFKRFQSYSREVGKYTFQIVCISQELERRLVLEDE